MIARIRTVKPALFIHSLLFELEKCTALPMRLAYVGLWCWTDRRARFEWKPRELKNGILPYDGCEFEHVLNVLVNAGFVVKYERARRYYGWIPRFLDHQNVNGREHESTLPAPPISAQSQYEQQLLSVTLAALSREALISEPVCLADGDESMPQPSGDGYVYYARSGNLMKIGYSKNPWARALELQTARPNLRLVALERGAPSLERTRHRQFHADHVEREWFRFSTTIETHVATCVVVSESQRIRKPGIVGAELLSSQNGNDDNLALEPVSTNNDTELTRGSRDTPRREGKGREEKGREGKRREEQDHVELVASLSGSAVASGTTPPVAATSSSSTEPAPGADRAAGANVGARERVVVGSDAPAVEIVHDNMRNVAALPALRGPRTSEAVQQRMAAVFADIQAGTRTRMKKDQLARLNAEIVFLYWVARFEHPRAILDAKREARILARLSENDGDVSELLYALDGAFHDDHIMARGEYAGRTTYDGIETVLRDRGQVEKFSARRKGFKAGKPHPGLARLAAAVNGDAPIVQGE